MRKILAYFRLNLSSACCLGFDALKGAHLRQNLTPTFLSTIALFDKPAKIKNMSSNTLFAIFLAMFPYWINAQYLQNELTASSGGTFQSTIGEQMDWSLGEPVVEQVGSTIQLSQGFLQVLDVTTPVFERNRSFFRVDLYPNPVSRQLTIVTDHQGPLCIALYDPNGSVHLTAQIQTPISHLELGSVPNGVYLLRISDRSGLIHTFPIVKSGF